MLSIIVPVYNVEKYLDECLSSLEKQTSKNFEVIIVNDGSTDNSDSIIRKYCKRINNCSYYTKENGGLMSAYLYGIEKSTGDYIGFVDSDDYIKPEFVEKMYDNNSGKSDIVICERIDIIEGEEEKKVFSKPLFSPGFYDINSCSSIYEKVLPPFCGEHISNARWNKIFRREIVTNNLKYCESKSRIMEDRFFTPSCMFSAKSFVFIPDHLYYYRQRKTGSNHSMPSPNLYNAIKTLIQTQKKMLLDKDIFQIYQKQYELACLNYMSLYIDRNLLIKEPFSTRLEYSKLIIKDHVLANLVKKHKKELKNKKGLAIRISYFLKSSTILALLCMLFKHN